MNDLDRDTKIASLEAELDLARADAQTWKEVASYLTYYPPSKKLLTPKDKFIQNIFDRIRNGEIEYNWPRDAA